MTHTWTRFGRPLWLVAVIAAAGAAAHGTPASGEGLRYVDKSAPAGGNGLSWSTAYRHLQDALAVAQAQGVSEIRVAQGTYSPDESAAAPNGTGSKTVKFKLRDGVAILGGFAGLQGVDPDERDLLAFPTILSGDLLGNDNGTPASQSDNSVNVVDGGNTLRSAILDGCAVTAAKSTGEGGGILIINGEGPTLRDCLIHGNIADNGAGAFISDSSPLVIGCRFTGNTATSNGGGVWNPSSGRPEFVNCFFSGNKAPKQSAVNIGEGSMRHCVVYANVCTSTGAAAEGSGFARNCIFWGNTGLGGGQSEQCTVLWTEYSIVQNLSFGYGFWSADKAKGNIALDPQFVDIDGPDNLPGTLDDDWHVLPTSPAIDRGNPWKPPPSGELDPDGDPRPLACLADIGIDEREGVGPDCNGNGVTDACELEAGTAFDCDANGVPDECDLASGAADCDNNGVLDTCDANALHQLAIPPTPVPSGSTLVTATFIDPPRANTRVQGFIQLSADVLASVKLVVAGSDVPGGPFFAASSTPCPDSPDVAFFEILEEDFNAMIAAGSLTVTLNPNGGDPRDCGGTSFIALTLTYGASSPRGDCNGNGVPDACDIESGLSADGNLDGVPDECQGVPGQILVPSPEAPTIQAGVDLAPNFFEVLLADGTFIGPGNKNVDLGGKAVVIRSMNGPEHCVIDLQNDGRAFLIDSFEDRDTVIEGITVVRAQTPCIGCASGGGGAMRIVDASPTIRGMHFVDNASSGGGGAIAIDGASAPLIEGCRFVANSSGAIQSESSLPPEVVSCDFVGNLGKAVADGGGAIGSLGPIKVLDCRFLGNLADNGMAIYLTGSAGFAIDGCVFSGNTRQSSNGSGAVVAVQSQGEIRRCTFSRNFNLSSTAGLSLVGTSTSVVVRDCLFWQNTGSSGGVFKNQVDLGDARIDIGWCNIEGFADQFVGQSLFAAPPLLSDPDGPDDIVGTDDDDLRLLDGSPCIDAGEPVVTSQPPPAGGDAGDPPPVLFCRADIGAEESPFFADCDDDGMPDACALAAGLVPDCDGDGTLDDCEADCDGDGEPDQCEAPPLAALVATAELPPPPPAAPTIVTIDNLATALSPVEVTLSARLGTASCNQTLTLYLDGVQTIQLKTCNFSCPNVVSAKVVLAPSAFNALAADGAIVATFTLSQIFGACPTAFVKATFAYDRLPDGSDCDHNGVFDDCDADCDGNGAPDACDFAEGAAVDCDGDGIIDGCAVAAGIAGDCDGDGVLDSCVLAAGDDVDCDGNGVPDGCDLVAGAPDYNHNGVPDVCESDCNGNGLPDFIDLALQLSADCDGNLVPDECDIAVGRLPDCDGSGVPDPCEIAEGDLPDCDGNGVPDGCDIAEGNEPDFNGNGIPDSCEADCNRNGIPDFLDLLFGASADANGNGVPDECEGENDARFDLDGDGAVGGGDLGVLLAAWGPCSPGAACLGDLDGDGAIGGGDLGLLLSAWEGTP